MSGGESSEHIQLQSEIRLLDSEDREKLLHTIGLHTEVSAEQGLALKADLAIPWNKLRVMRRYNNRLIFSKYSLKLIVL